MNIYFARHGESEANLENVISNRDLIHPLTQTGREQAANLAEHLIDTGITGIFCSPIQRAVETAVIIGAILKVPVAKADALSEFDCGIMEGRSDDKAWFEVGRAVRTWLEKDDLDYKIEGGESCHEVQDRFFIFVNRLIQLGRDETFLLISHGGTLRLTIPFLFQNLPSTLYQDHFFGYTDYAVAEVVEGKLICREWCGQKMFS